VKGSIIVPASSANLGPGYDSFGLALGIYNGFEGEIADTWRVEIGGEGAGRLPSDETNPVVRAMARLFAEVGQPDLAAEVACHNGIPVGRGLGSSAAAIVGGLVLADALTGAHLGRQRLFELAAEIEGHADNVAAAIYGGFTVTSRAAEGLTCAHVDPAGGLAAIAVIGEAELPTAEARAALPESVPHADAAFNAGRAALVALGLATGTREFLEAGLRDAIHERYREDLVPDLGAVRSLLEAIEPMAVPRLSLAPMLVRRLTTDRRISATIAEIRSRSISRRSACSGLVTPAPRASTR
jgi:homoserine kinase